MAQRYHILVTGVGAIIGYGIVNCLKRCKYDVRVVGIDIFADAVGQLWCDQFHRGELAESEKFLPFVTQLIDNERIDLVIPGIEQDLAAFVRHRDQLPGRAKYVVGNDTMLDSLSDKWKTQQLFAEADVKRIPSVQVSEPHDFQELADVLGTPLVLKPRVSYASKGLGVVDNAAAFQRHLAAYSQFAFIAQRLMRGEELTVSVFGNGDGTFSNAIALERSLAPDGSTQKARWRNPRNILPQLSAYVQTFRPLGPTNLQFIIEDGYPYLLEINPRISSSTSIRELCGVNEAEMCIEYYLRGAIPEQRQQRPVTCVRYIADAVFP